MRKPTYADLRKVQGYHDGHFPLPNMDNPEYVIAEVSDNADSFAFVKLTSETGIILNPSVSDFEKARLIAAHFHSIREGLPVSDTHVFVTKGEDHFAKMLVKHFDFVEATGKPLYWSK